MPYATVLLKFVSCLHDVPVLEGELEAELYGARPMGIQGMQERRSRNTIGAATFKAGGIRRAGIATDDVVSTAARIVGIVNSKLGVVENVERLGPELNLP